MHHVNVRMEETCPQREEHRCWPVTPFLHRRLITRIPTYLSRVLPRGASHLSLSKRVYYLIHMREKKREREGRKTHARFFSSIGAHVHIRTADCGARVRVRQRAMFLFYRRM